MKVLHVTHRWGGGIKTVVQQYVAATESFEHLLLRGQDPWMVPGRESELFAKQFDMPAGWVEQVRVLKTLVAQESVDVVHAHSSASGAVARLRRRDRAATVYTPNAFATLAPRFSKEWISGQTEWLLGRRTATIAAVSVDEATRASLFSPSSQVIRITNLPYLGLRPVARFQQPARVVMCGRIGPQKGPEFFADTARILRPEGHHFVWLGDGDPESRRKLEAAGVQVAGWLPLSELHRRQSDASIYLHSARYEGNCLSVLDAAALGLPSIGRFAPGVAELSWMQLTSDPMSAAVLVRELTVPATWHKWHACAVEGADRLTMAHQRQGLEEAYTRAIRQNRRA